MRLQIALYGLAARRELEYEPERGLIRYLGEADPARREVAVSLDDPALDVAWRTLVDTARRIRRTEFEVGPAGAGAGTSGASAAWRPGDAPGERGGIADSAGPARSESTSNRRRHASQVGPGQLFAGGGQRPSPYAVGSTRATLFYRRATEKSPSIPTPTEQDANPATGTPLVRAVCRMH